MESPSPETLQNDPRYELLLVIRHDDLMPFLEEYLFSRHPVMRLFWTINALILVAAIAAAFKDTGQGLISWGALIRQFILGVLLLLSVGIVLHEGIHGLAYKISGAPRVSFGVNWRWFYFYAIADRFVIGRKKFYFVALAPFVVITLAIIAGLFYADVETKWVLWSVLLFHTGACAGDIAILTFYLKYQHFPDLLTFDDRFEGKSYFYLMR
ncbi:MAG: hypothetical protein Kow0027_03470 [Saprospiraceae bacterium]